MIPFLEITSRLKPLVFGLAFTSFSTAFGTDWPAWRGPTGDGVSTESHLPTTWSRTQNVRWQVILPGPGNSTPIVWEDKVLITQAIDEEHRRLLICFDRRHGNERWRSGVVYDNPETTHRTNPQCSGSPVTDGTRVYVSFGSAGLYCYDLQGRELWGRHLGKQAHIWGNGASPVLYDELCILNFGPGERTFLLAVDKHSGTTVWRHDEPGGAFGRDRNDWIGSWTTPIIRRINDNDQLIMIYPNRVCAFDPETGEELWSCRGLNPLVYTSPLFKDDLVVAMGGFSGKTVAVKATGTGDVTETHRLWLHPKTKQRIGSGVIAGNFIYVHNDPGIAECFELESGNLVWEERLRGDSAKNTNWSSMMLAGDKIYSLNQSGDTFVLRASPTFELLAVNSLNEPSNSSVVPSNGELFIRTHQSLWCIGMPE